MKRFLALTAIVAIIQVSMPQTAMIVTESPGIAGKETKREVGNATSDGTLQDDDLSKYEKRSDDAGVRNIWLVAFVACTSSMGVILFAYALLATVCQKKTAPVARMTEVKTEKATPLKQKQEEEKQSPETDDITCSTAELYSSAQLAAPPQE
ncbi:hypothetical protein TTRE_0000436701 [Trichuris trichiura]|uniref:Uncharacterized protein n=1 Tax=Trichuris trichiura TaxID=36087 RepID=A0A077Z8V9_TRITR|nr:hypothetical protein TTRE_0000436701 [Trichuris trichiura]